MDACSNRQRIRVGCAGWNIPKQSVAHFGADGSHQSRYAQLFNCCEINSSFYRPHKPATWERWGKAVPADFRFSVKMPREITHEAKLNCDSEPLTKFFNQIAFLGDRLGPVLVQLPPSLKFEGARAQTFFSLLRRVYSGNIALEPRHSTWFEQHVDFLLKDFRVARVAADPACVPAAAQPGGWPRLAYFRLHGSPRQYYSDYSSAFLQRLSAQLSSLAAASPVWCIFDNTAAGYATENARELISRMTAAD